MTDKQNQDLRAFAIGAAGYSLMELAYRRRTHWTMALTGGLCFALIHKLYRRRPARAKWAKCLIGAGLITSVEFAVGLLVNKLLNWDVWDYSGSRFNLLGQVCPKTSLCWFALGLPMIHLSNWLSKR